MKYVIVLGDGMAGEPVGQLGGMTTLEASKTPVMDRLAKMSEQGMARMVPKGMAPGSDTANLSVAGYDPQVYYTGRSPLEALSIGVDMKADDVAFRCNFVTLSEEAGAYEDRIIIDHSSDEISTEDAVILLEALKKEFAREGYHFYAGTSYRHLLIQHGGEVLELTPPHDILTRRIGAYLPKDPVLLEMMKKSFDILENHPVNLKRRRDGLHPANSIWFWGAGTRPALSSFLEKTGKKAVMISAVDLLKGIAVGAGMTPLFVEGANGGLYTNYDGKAKAALNALLNDGYDFAYIHVEAPDEMGHQGSVERKIQAIENLDSRVIKIVKEGLDASGEPYKMLIMPDHPTPICLRTHVSDPVPYMIYDSRVKRNETWHYNEREARESGIQKEHGWDMMAYLLS